MKKGILLFWCLGAWTLLQAQENVTELTAQEAAAVAAILARENQSAPVRTDADTIILPEETKKEALSEVQSAEKQAAPQPSAAEQAAPQPATSPAEQAAAQAAPQEKAAQAAPETVAAQAQGTSPEPAAAPQETEPTQEADEPEDMVVGKKQKCLVVAFVDIDEAFNAHPRTVAVKAQIREKILSKEDEVQKAKDLIRTLKEENERLSRQLKEIKPFYERIVIEPHPLLPKIEESADSVELGNVLNRLTFAGVEVLSNSPVNTPTEVTDIKEKLAANKATIAERELFIDTYKYTTREEILKLEQQEVKDILQDIYKEIKSFAKKRNIGAVVRKDEVLYGEQPVNVTKDFINRLKKSKKFRKRGK